MRRGVWIMLWSLCCLAAAPSRDNTYVTGTAILPGDVMDNEDAIFDYLQDGVDTIADGAVGTADLANNAVTSAKILDGTITTADLAFSVSSGTLLPSGAVYFLVTGSCPAGTTDVSSSYSNRFIRVNATAGNTGGADTHTHTAGSYVGAAHTHSVPFNGWSNVAATAGGSSLSCGKGETEQVTNANNTTGSGGGGAVTGTSASGDNVPAFITMKLCQVN